MYVSSETILRKIEAQLKKASTITHDQQAFVREIEKVKLLCDVLLEEADSSDGKGERIEAKRKESPSLSQSQNTTNEQDQLEETVMHDPKSIFDF